MGKISEVDWARLAAYVDGEGTIEIYKENRKDGYIEFALRLHVTNSDRRLLEWIENRFGGYISPPRVSRPKQKAVYDWRVRSYSAYKLIIQFRKFLIIKGERADIAILFWEECGRRTRRMSGNGRPNWMKQKQESYYQEMKQLNKRGVERSEV